MEAALPIWGFDTQEMKRVVLGTAPPAPRPKWMAASGPGQANVEPLRWSLSVKQWIGFVRACMKTETWKALAHMKGEYKINMYDVNQHFVIPWTKGTGSSLALLMNCDEQSVVQLMLSHAWAGSVLESYNCLQNLVNHTDDINMDTRIFFCTFCMYQCADDAEGGLSIGAQVDLAPFQKVIASRPKHGMAILHTTISEVYGRLWVAHEADVGIDAEIQMRGAFDFYRWTLDKFQRAEAVHTKDGGIGVEKDRVMIDGLIMAGGGYERLDAVIRDFRGHMRSDLEAMLAIKSPPKEVTQLCSVIDGSARVQFKYDWVSMDGYEKDGRDYDFWKEVDWRYAAAWEGVDPDCEDLSEDVVRTSYLEGVDITSLSSWKDDRGKSENKFELTRLNCALPVGTDAFPFGGPRRNFNDPLQFTDPSIIERNLKAKARAHWQ